METPKKITIFNPVIIDSYRSPILILAILFIIISGCSTGKEEGKADHIISGDLPRPSWIADTPLVFIGNWDAMPIFRRRVGGNPTWQQDAYYQEHTEETVKQYKEMGVTMMLLHFFKGFGLEAEKEHIEEAKKLASICKENGLKVGVYVGSTIGYETFLLEEPEAEEWFVPDYQGLPLIYGNQTFRKRVYFMHPGFINYMKKVVKVAIEDLKVDLIHFDNTSMRAQPVIFYHPLAIDHFRKYLKQKYSPDLLIKRFGFADISYVEPPKHIQPRNKIDDPLFQEWTDFRCQQLADFYGIMENYIRSLNPEVAVCNNPHSGLSGHNTMWTQGVDYPRLLSHTDIIWTEEGNDPAVTEDGILISKIRTYKMAKSLNNRVFTYTTDSKLEMAEAMAYNRQGMGMVGGLKEMEGNQQSQGFELPEDQKAYIKFFHENFEFYRGIEDIADVAVLHSYNTMAYNNDLPYQSTFLFEQVLIQNKILFDIIFDDQLKNLSRYKVLVLADQECLSEEQINVIRDYVEQGGGLVATEFTSLYTEWRERKSDFGLKDLFRVDPPLWNGRNFPESFLSIPIQKNLFGKGKVVYIPEIRPTIPKPAAAAMISRYWKLPQNSGDMVDAVKWASGGEMSITINAPQEITAELNISQDKDKMMLHLVNYNSANNIFAKNIEVSIVIPGAKQVKGVQLLSPDTHENISLNFDVKDGKVQFVVPLLKIYNLVVINLH